MGNKFFVLTISAVCSLLFFGCNNRVTTSNSTENSNTTVDKEKKFAQAFFEKIHDGKIEEAVQLSDPQYIPADKAQEFYSKLHKTIEKKSISNFNFVNFKITNLSPTLGDTLSGNTAGKSEKMVNLICVVQFEDKSYCNADYLIRGRENKPPTMAGFHVDCK